MFFSKFKLFFWSINQLVRAAPYDSALLIFLIIIQGIVPGLSLYVIENLINFLSSAQSTADFPYSLVILWSTILFFDYALAPLVSIVRIQLNEKILTHCNILLMQKSNSFAGLEPFEDINFYDQIQFLKDEAKRKPLNFVYIIVGTLKDAISLFSIIFILATLNFWIPIYILLASLPHAISMMRFEKLSWDQMLFQSPQARRMAWFSSITLDDKAAQEIRLFGFGDYFIQGYMNLAERFSLNFRKERFYQSMQSIALSSLTVIGYSAIFIWILLYTLSKEIEIGSSIIILQAFVMTQTLLSSFMQNFAMIFPVISFFEKLRKLLGLKFAISHNEKGKTPFNGLGNKICFENVSFKYPDGRLALKNINLTIKANEKIALVGENGAGKSTLIKLLMRMYDPTEGRITIDGVDLKELNILEWRKSIGAVFQDFGKYHLTAQENIGLGDYTSISSLDKIHHAAIKGGFNEVFERLPEKENTLLGKEFGGTSLSVGEWQKLAMSRAFMRDAEILILDEPTASLDPKSEHEVFKKFSTNADNKTTIFITHRLGSVLMADRIIVMKSGRIVEEGTHHELISSKGDYQVLFTMQASRYENISQASK